MKKHIIFLGVLILVFTYTNTFSQSDTLELPFIEDWSSGSLETNGWMVEGDGWLINNNMGDPAPSMEFRAELVSGEGYTSTLTSKPINAETKGYGYIYLDFNLQLDNNNETGQERLSVEVSTDGGDNWIRVTSLTNSEDRDFEITEHISIDHLAIGSIFSIRFIANGVNQEDIDSWFIDNIQVYSECHPPYYLEGDYYWSGGNWGAEICWKNRNFNQPLNSFHWGNDIYAGGTTSVNGGNFSVAQRWDAGQLKNWNGMDYSDALIAKIAIVIGDYYLDSLALRIWSGPNAEELLYERFIPQNIIIIGEVVEYLLEEPLEFDIDEELWIGYTIFSQEVVERNTAGYDKGPAIPGYGDMISSDGINWSTLSERGIDHNWFIWSMFLNNQSDTLSPQNFNIYRQVVGEDDDYILYDKVNYDNDLYNYCYKDLSPQVGSGKTHNYKVSALWIQENDTCESAFAKIPEETDDYVSILITEMVESEISGFSIQPNPFTTSTTISYNLNQSSTVQVSIFNHLGIQIDIIQQNQISGQQQVTWDASGIPSGVYYFRLEAGKQVATGKVVKL